jgi:hypothetical protein
VFPALAAVLTPTRVYLTSASGDPDEDLIVNIITANTNTFWNAELLLSYATITGSFEFTNHDTNQTKVRLTVIDSVDAYRMTVTSNYQHHEFVIRAAGVAKAVVQLDSSTSTPTVLNAIFIPYTEVDAAVWATNNPSGLGQTFVEDAGDFSENYGTSGGGRYSVAI